MAESDQSREVVSDPFGVSYDPAVNKWRKTRTFSTFGSLKPLRSIQQYTPGQPSYSHGMQTAAPARRVAVRKLTRAKPELLPGMEIAMENFHDSSRVMEQPEHLMGELIAIGYIPEAEKANGTGQTRSKQQRTILAMLTGSSVDTISIIALSKSVSNFDRFPGIELDTSEPKGGLATTWSVKGASVRQITFTPDRKEWPSVLAIRTATTIHILRVGMSDSELHVVHELEIPLKGYLTFECAYISFNQHDRRGLAGVSSSGEIVLWGLWNRKTGHLTYNVRHKGFLSPDTYGNSNEARKITQDGWKRIGWGTGPGRGGTLLLCDRDHIECWNASDLKFLTAYRLPPAAKFPLVDLLVCKLQYSEIFLLTTGEVRMLRLHVEPSNTRFEALLLWQHGRDHGDLLLRMSELNYGLDKHLILYSHKNGLVTVFSLQGSTAETIHCREEARMPWRHVGVLGIVHQRPPNLPRLVRNESEIGKLLAYKEVPIWELFFLAQDLSLHGCICFAQLRPVPTSVKISFAAPSHILDTGRDDSPAPRTNPLEPEFRNGEEEGYESGIDRPDPNGGRYPHIFQSFNYSVPRQRVLNAMTASWKDYLELGRDTLDGLCTRILSSSSNRVKVLDSLAAYALISINTEDDEVTGSLADEVEKRLGQKGFDEAGKWLVAPFATSDLLGLAKIGIAMPDFGIADIYRQLLTVYNRPINATIRGQQRLLKEAIARRVASILCSAAIGVRFSSASEDTQEVGTFPRMTQNSQRSAQSTQQYPSQAMPSSMGVEMASSAGETLADQVDPVAHSLASLGKFTLITPSSADSTSMLRGSAKGLSEVLAHWDENVDPSQYSYEATNAMLAGETFIQGSAMSIADREKAARREMKARQRQVARQARSEATAAKHDSQDSFFSNRIPLVKMVHGEAVEKESQPQGSQAQRAMKSSNTGESVEGPSLSEAEGISRLTIAAEENLNSSRKRSQQSSMPSQSSIPRNRLPDRGRKPPKKRGF